MGESACTQDMADKAKEEEKKKHEQTRQAKEEEEKKKHEQELLRLEQVAKEKPNPNPDPNWEQVAKEKAQEAEAAQAAAKKAELAQQAKAGKEGHVTFAPTVSGGTNTTVIAKGGTNTTVIANATEGSTAMELQIPTDSKVPKLTKAHSFGEDGLMRQKQPSDDADGTLLEEDRKAPACCLCCPCCGAVPKKSTDEAEIDRFIEEYA